MQLTFISTGIIVVVVFAFFFQVAIDSCSDLIDYKQGRFLNIYTLRPYQSKLLPTLLN